MPTHIQKVFYIIDGNARLFVCVVVELMIWIVLAAGVRAS